MDLFRSYSKRSDLLAYLTSTVEQLRSGGADGSSVAGSVRSESVSRVWRVRDRISDADIDALVAAYQDGTTGRELAERFGVSRSSVKRILRVRRARRKDTA